MTLRTESADGCERLFGHEASLRIDIGHHAANARRQRRQPSRLPVASPVQVSDMLFNERQRRHLAVGHDDIRPETLDTYSGLTADCKKP